MGEIEAARQDVDENHGRENQSLGRGREVNEILLSAFVAFLVLVVGHQRIGADADNFVEQVERQKIVRERAAHGAEQRQGKAGIEARLGVFLEAAHVTGGVKNRQHPEERSGDGEDHRERIRPQGDAQAREQLKHGVEELLPGAHLRNHRRRDGEEGGGGEKRAGLAEIGPLAGDHDQARSEQRRQDGEEQSNIGRGVHGPIRSNPTIPGC